VPSDRPRMPSWARVIHEYPTRNNEVVTHLNHLKVSLMCLANNLFTPVDGNHTIARLTQLYGPEHLVSLRTDPGIYHFTLEAVQDRQTEGINTFLDYLDLIHAMQ